MILVLFGLAMAVACGAVWMTDRRRRRRFDTQPRCGGCAHLLAPGQMQCPECGRAWTDADPGAARVFGHVADRCERFRRASIVAAVALGTAAAACTATGGLYLAGVLPIGYATNAWWYAPIETRTDAGQEWTAVDSELWVLVRGVRLDPSGFVAGAPMERVDEVLIVKVLREPRTEPAVGVGSEISRGLGLRVLVEPGAIMLRDRWNRDDQWKGDYGPYSFGSPTDRPYGLLNWKLGPYRFSPASPELQSKWDLKLTELVLETCKGKDVRAHIRWGEQGTSVTTQDVAHRRASRVQQLAIAALVVGAAIAVAATALVRAALRSLVPAVRPQRAEWSSS